MAVTAGAVLVDFKLCLLFLGLVRCREKWRRFVMELGLCLSLRLKVLWMRRGLRACFEWLKVKLGQWKNCLSLLECPVGMQRHPMRT